MREKVLRGEVFLTTAFIAVDRTDRDRLPTQENRTAHIFVIGTDDYTPNFTG